MSTSTPSDGTKGPVEIKGSPVENINRPPVRRELRDMRRNHPEEWTLFLLGLERFKETDERHPLSYFQIAGIHGRPYTYWPEEDWNKGNIKHVDPNKEDPSQWQGFCTHSSILFLPWHRPYLALFETELRRHVRAVAKEYTLEEGYNAYVKAAETFRLPYWDWALPADKDISVFPWEAVAETKHKVMRPKSKKVITEMAENPLARYKFGGLAKSYRKDGEVIDIHSTIGATVRWPFSDEAGLRARLAGFSKQAASPESVPDNKWNDFYRKGKNLTERVLYLLQSYESFGPISSNYYFKKQKFANWGSLEDVHNSIHGLVGNKGHMNYPEVAAFDPIFWLHHANIDRLYAIWQALWDDGKDASKYVTPQASKQEESDRGGTYSNPRSANDTIDTALTPFTQSEDGDMWTSRDSRNTSTFGYVYPETQRWRFPTKEDIFRQLQSIYGLGSLASTIRETAKTRSAASETLSLRGNTLLALETAPIKTTTLVEATSTDLSASKAPQSVLAAASQVKLPADRFLSDLVRDNKYLEWLVDLRAEKHSLAGNFVVHVFLGDPDDTAPLIYIADPNHVATFSTFGTSEDTGCEKCKQGQEARMHVTGQVPLTIALVERYLAGKLDSITPDHVIPYLQTHLHWRVTDNGGARGHRADVAGLLVSVVSNEVTLPEDSSASTLPRYAPDVTPWPAATTRENGEPRGRGTGYTGGQPIDALA